MPDSADEATAAPSPGSGSFPTTQWSLVLHAGANSNTQARAALESLCGRYWYPLYVFVRRQGRDHHEAQDCTQEFFAQLLAADGLQRARPERGRFRTFLLTGLRNFLVSEWRRTHAAKRGGALAHVPLEVQTADERFCHDAPDPGLTPEQAFDRSWALGLLDLAVNELRLEYQKIGREALFEILAPLLWSRSEPEAFTTPAQRAGLDPRPFAQALHRARRRFGDCLRTIVAETVADPTEIDAELRHLVGAISASTSGRGRP